MHLIELVKKVQICSFGIGCWISWKYMNQNLPVFGFLIFGHERLQFGQLHVSIYFVLQVDGLIVLLVFLLFCFCFFFFNFLFLFFRLNLFCSLRLCLLARRLCFLNSFLVSFLFFPSWLFFELRLDLDKLLVKSLLLFFLFDFWHNFRQAFALPSLHFRSNLLHLFWRCLVLWRT